MATLFFTQKHVENNVGCSREWVGSVVGIGREAVLTPPVPSPKHS